MILHVRWILKWQDSDSGTVREDYVSVDDLHPAGEEGAYALDGLAQIRRHGSFSITCKSLIINSYLYSRSRLAGIG